jgi:putative tricarboxylic transport membrane protein
MAQPKRIWREERSMNGAIKNPKDFWTGVLYVAFGGAAFWIARDYGMGTASRMGPGYFPTVLSALLMLFGVISIVRSFLVPGEAIGKLALKAAALILGATILFGFFSRAPA